MALFFTGSVVKNYHASRGFWRLLALKMNICVLRIAGISMRKGKLYGMTAPLVTAVKAYR
jgi:hypothetical protein